MRSVVCCLLVGAFCVSRGVCCLLCVSCCLLCVVGRGIVVRRVMFVV